MPSARTGAARRFAEAAFSIAKDDNSLDEWARDLATIARAVADPRIGRLLESPAVGMAIKEKIATEYLAGISDKARNLVVLLLHKGRLSLAPQIADYYTELLNQYRGVATADVVTAVQLNPDELDFVARKLSEMSGRRVKVSATIDPSIIGGIVARVGDQLIDASVKGRLEALKRRLASV